ncbi:MAG: hypothetical protein ACXWF9_01065 [Solirubrobacterales bacterium]
MKRAMLIAPCLCLALSASPALAKKKGKKAPFGPVVTVTALGNSVATPGASSATATCPKGTKAVGGGFAGQFNSTNQMAIEQSYRSSDRSWNAVAHVLEGTSAVTAYAYCRKTKKAIEDVAATGTTAGVPLGPGTATASCPAGTRVIGGGFQATRGPAPQNVTTTETSIPSGNGWTVRAINNVGPSQTLTAHAYCVAGIKPKIVSATISQDVPQEASVTTSSAACPKPKAKKKGGAGKSAKGGGKKKQIRKRLSGGGFETPVGANPGVVPLVWESRIAGPLWQASAAAQNDPGVLPVTSVGICL